MNRKDSAVMNTNLPESPLTHSISVDIEDFHPINGDASGAHRRDLINILGRDRAKGFMLRHGFNAGRHNAIALRKNYPDASENFLVEKGLQLHFISGINQVEMRKTDVNMKEGKFYFEVSWVESHEANQYLTHFNFSKIPVCWAIVGHASGFCSTLFGTQIIFKEITCTGSGDHSCYMVGKMKEDWGEEINEELLFYQVSTIEEELDEAYLRIKQQHHLLQKIMTINEQLTQLALAGHDNGAIIKSVGQILSSPVIFEDHQFRVLASWSPSTPKNHVTSLSLEPLLDQYPKLYKLLKKIEKSKRAIDILPKDFHGIPARTIVPIILGEEFIGYLSVIHQTDVDKSEIRTMVAERAANVIGINLLKERTRLEIEHRLTGEFIEELLSERVSYETLRNRANYMGHDLDQPHQFLIIKIDPPWSLNGSKKEQSTLYSLRKELFHLAYSVVNTYLEKAYVVERREGIVILASTIHKSFNPNIIANEIKTRFTKLKIKATASICISRVSTSIEQLRSTYFECLTALQSFTNLGKVDTIFAVNEIHAFELLFANPEHRQLTLYAEHFLEKLLNYDNKHSSELLQTLNVYLSLECNLQKTSESMNLSLSGLKYRLQRIKEIGELDLEDADTRFNLQLSLRILVTRGMIKVKLNS